MTVAQDVQSSTPGAVTELYILDATARSQGIFYFTNDGPNEKGNPIVYNGNTFVRLTCKGSGWGKTINGAPPRPTITVDNTQRVMQAAVIAAGDLTGTKLTRIRILTKYLDAANFNAGNANADPTQVLTNESYVINRKIMHNNKLIQFELCWVLDLPTLRLPARLVLRDSGFPGVSLNRR